MRINRQAKSATVRRLIGVLGATGIAAGLLLAPTSAQASVQETCTGALGCLWHDQNFQGRTKHLDRNELNLHPEGHGDKAHSAWNRSGFWMALYEDDGYRGLCITIKPNGYRGTPSRVWDFSAYKSADGRNWGDRISSVQFFQAFPVGCTEVRSG